MEIFLNITPQNLASVTLKYPSPDFNCRAFLTFITHK